MKLLDKPLGTPVRRIPEKTFRSELVELMRKHGAPVEGITGLLSIHFNNGNIDWTKMETNNQL